MFVSINLFCTISSILFFMNALTWKPKLKVMKSNVVITKSAFIMSLYVVVSKSCFDIICTMFKSHLFFRRCISFIHLLGRVFVTIINVALDKNAAFSTSNILFTTSLSYISRGSTCICISPVFIFPFMCVLQSPLTLSIDFFPHNSPFLLLDLLSMIPMHGRCCF